MMKARYLPLLFLLCCGISPEAMSFYDSSVLTVSADNGSPVQVAGIYWLPDYLKDNVDNNHRVDEDKGGGDIALECEKYSPNCTFPQILGGKEVRVAGNLFCKIECVCPSNYQTTFCDSEYTYRGTACRYNGKNYYQGCDPKPCSAGGYYDSGSQTGKICTAVAYGGRSCYSCVNDPCYGLSDKSPCAYGCQTTFSVCPSKCQVCYEDNCRNRTAVSAPYGCEKTFADCSSKCEKAYPDNCRNRTNKSCDYGCEKFYSDCGSKCESCKACSNSCGTGYGLEECAGSTPILEDSKTNQCGNTCRKCRARTCEEENARCPVGTLNLDYYYSNAALRCLMK